MREEIATVPRFVILLPCLFMLLGLPGPRLAEAQPAGVDDPVVALLIEGRIDAIRGGLEGGMWAGSASEALARALLEVDGLDAATAFEALLERPDATAEQRAVAWHRLYGYHVLTGYGGKAEQALRELLKQPALAQQLFHGNVPDPDELHKRSESAEPGGGSWALQIGTFSERANADRLAGEQHQVEAEVRQIRRGGRTLYVVYAGSFPTHNAAESFGRQHYGSPGRDFLIVQLD